jgi:hypothetical protein
MNINKINFNQIKNNHKLKKLLNYKKLTIIIFKIHKNKRHNLQV